MKNLNSITKEIFKEFRQIPDLDSIFVGKYGVTAKELFEKIFPDDSVFRESVRHIDFSEPYWRPDPFGLLRETQQVGWVESGSFFIIAPHLFF